MEGRCISLSHSDLSDKQEEVINKHKGYPPKDISTLMFSHVQKITFMYARAFPELYNPWSFLLISLTRKKTEKHKDRSSKAPPRRFRFS